MISVTSDEVKSIMDGSIGGDLTVFIDTANVVVKNNLTVCGYDDDTLRQITIYLSAHFASNKYRQLQSEGFGDSKDVYQGKTGMNLDATYYGQNAKLLDHQGALSKIGQGTAELESL